MITTVMIMVVILIVPRAEAELAKRAGANLLIYGRRKTGKTFIVRNFLRPDVYALVKRGGGVNLEGAPLPSVDSHQQFMDLLQSLLKDGKTVAVDEFQRLPPDFLDAVQALDPQGNLILTGSSLRIVKDIISPRSPILGLFAEVRVSLINPVDIFNSLSKETDPVTAFALSPYLRDPWAIQYFKGAQTSVTDILALSREAIRALVGEVFLEEERTLTMVYEGILRSLAIGKWRLGEVADLLYSRGLIDRPGQNLIRPYFNSMEEMDLVLRVPVFGKNDHRYLIKSPLMELGFRLDERYNFFQQEIPVERLLEVFQQSMPFHIERFCGELFARVYGGVYEYFHSPDFDIDFIVTAGGKVLASGEVKWTSSPGPGDVDTFLQRTRHLPGDKIFFSKKPVGDGRVIALSPSNIAGWIKKRSRRSGRPAVQNGLPRRSKPESPV